MRTRSVSDLRSCSERQLFVTMTRGRGRTATAKAAFCEFVRRYNCDLRRHVLAVHKDLVGDCTDRLEEFVQRVFIHFWQYGVLVFDPNVSASDEGLPKLARYWLKKSADYVRKQWRPERELEWFTTSTSVAAPTNAEDEDLESIFIKAEAVLTSIEIQLLIVCYHYYDPNTQTCLVPPDQHLKICSDLGFPSWPAARKCKQRAEETLRDFLKSKEHVA